jgi:hypothetical protein
MTHLDVRMAARGVRALADASVRGDDHAYRRIFLSLLVSYGDSMLDRYPPPEEAAADLVAWLDQIEAVAAVNRGAEEAGPMSDELQA